MIAQGFVTGTVGLQLTHSKDPRFCAPAATALAVLYFYLLTCYDRRDLSGDGQGLGRTVCVYVCMCVWVWVVRTVESCRLVH